VSVDEVVILSIKDFNKRQGESQQEIAGKNKRKNKRWRVWRYSKE